MVTKCKPTYMGNSGLVVTIWLPLGTFAGFRVTKVWSVKASHEIAERHTRCSLRAASGPSKAQESSLALCRSRSGLAAQHELTTRKWASTNRTSVTRCQETFETIQGGSEKCWWQLA